MIKKQSELGFVEFVALMATMMALTALSIDAFLPALPDIGKDLKVIDNEDYQLIISFLFLGLAVGQMFYGPIADNIGRKPTVYIGMFVFLIGSVMSIYSTSLSFMLAGRVIQGLGLASPRIVCIAMIRDKFKGDRMAKGMSFILAVLILAPILAPSLGQFVLKFYNWRSIFTVILIYALIITIWFYFRQTETLKSENKIPFSFQKINHIIGIVLQNKTTMGFTIAAGFISGSFLGFLNSIQELFQVHFELGDQFPLYFGIIATSVGLASITNGNLVMRFGMLRISITAIVSLFLISISYLVMYFIFHVEFTLPVILGYLLFSLFCIGFLFGNLTSLAMEPLGKVAGIGSGIVGSFTTFISIPIGIVIGKLYDDSAIPMIIGFAVFSFLAYLIIVRTRRSIEFDLNTNTE